MPNETQTRMDEILPENVDLGGSRKEKEIQQEMSGMSIEDSRVWVQLERQVRLANKNWEKSTEKFKEMVDAYPDYEDMRITGLALDSMESIKSLIIALDSERTFLLDKLRKYLSEVKEKKRIEKKLEEKDKRIDVLEREIENLEKDEFKREARRPKLEPKSKSKKKGKEVHHTLTKGDDEIEAEMEAETTMKRVWEGVNLSHHKVTERDILIYNKWREMGRAWGSFAKIARQFNLSRQRTGQIVRRVRKIIRNELRKRDKEDEEIMEKLGGKLTAEKFWDSNYRRKKKKSRWDKHLEKVKKKYPSKTYGEVMEIASKSYTKDSELLEEEEEKLDEEEKSEDEEEKSENFDDYEIKIPENQGFTLLSSDDLQIRGVNDKEEITKSGKMEKEDFENSEDKQPD